MSGSLIPAALTCCCKFTKPLWFKRDSDCALAAANLPSACHRLYCSLLILFCSILLLASIALITAVPLLALSLMSRSLIFHVKHCLRSLAVSIATWQPVRVWRQLRWFARDSGCALAPNMPPAYQRLYYSLRILFCSILLLAPVTSYATACFLMRFCSVSDVHSDCPSLRFVSNYA